MAMGEVSPWEINKKQMKDGKKKKKKKKKKYCGNA